MPSQYGLSEIEYEFMQFFWACNKPVSFAEVMHYCNEEKKHSWAQTTVHTYLTRLIQKGVLTSTRKGYKRSYKAQVSEAELSHAYASQFVAEAYDGSIKNLLLSLTYNTKLSREEARELHQILDDHLS